MININQKNSAFKKFKVLNSIYNGENMLIQNQI